MEIDRDFFDIMGSKYSGREVPSFDEGNWKSMKNKIDASRKGKKRAVLYIASCALLLCLGGVSAFYEWDNNSIKKNNTVQATSFVNSNKKVSIGNDKHSIVSSNSPAGVSHSNIAISHGSLAKENIVKKAKSASQLHLAQTMADNSIPHSRSNHTKQNSKLSSSLIASNNNISFNNNQKNNVTQVTGQNNLTIEHEKPLSLPMPTKMLSPVVNTAFTQATVIEKSEHKSDTVATADVLPKRFSDEPRIFRGKTNIFSVELGTEYSFGWQIGSVIQGRAFNEFIGMGYAHYMGSRLFLKTGLQFSTFNGMNTLPYNYQHNVGNVVYDSSITTKSLYFLRIPVQLEYSVGSQKRSSIGLGGSVWFLVGNTGFATTDQQLDNNPPINIIEHSQNASLNEYSKVNASIHLLYRYTINHHFSVYGLWYFEATNMKNNSFFGDGIIHRTNGPQVTASYSL